MVFVFPRSAMFKILQKGPYYKFITLIQALIKIFHGLNLILTVTLFEYYIKNIYSKINIFDVFKIHHEKYNNEQVEHIF